MALQEDCAGGGVTSRVSHTEDRPVARKQTDKSTGKKPPCKRHRKAHRKSRLGCQNCKLRSIKCDEAKPSCQRCLASNFACVYAATNASASSKDAALQLAHAGVFQFHLGRSKAAPSPVPVDVPPPDPHILLPVASAIPHAEAQYKLNSRDFQALKIYHTHIITKIGSASMRPSYHAISPVLGRNHAYMMHIYLMLAYLHDLDRVRSKGSEPSQQLRTSLAFHWYQATLLHKASIVDLKHTTSEADAIWAAAYLLAGGTTGYLETYDPAAHWPNGPRKQHGPSWLRLSISRRALWDVLRPNRGDSIYSTMYALYERPDPLMPIPSGFFSSTFMSFFQLTAGVADKGNPYFTAATVLAQIIPDRCDTSDLCRFTALSEYLDEDFCDLLDARDTRALILLAWWWAKLSVSGAMFISRRATVEGRAICLYLEREHAADARVQELVEYPRAVFSLLDESLGAATTRSTYISDSSLANTKARSASSKELYQGALVQLDSITTRCNSNVFL